MLPILLSLSSLSRLPEKLEKLKFIRWTPPSQLKEMGKVVCVWVGGKIYENSLCHGYKLWLEKELSCKLQKFSRSFYGG